MEWNRIARRRGLAAATALVLAFGFMPRHASAQTNPETAKPCEAKPGPPAQPGTIKTIFLTNASDQNDLNDIQTDLRNALPNARIYGVQSQNAITLRATAEDLETAQKMIADLDRPKTLYRLTFTITDIDGGKKVGLQQFVLLAVVGQRTIFKQGTRVPIVAGVSGDPKEGSQVQYQDAGLSIEARLGGSAEALALHAKIEQSSVSDEKSTAAAQDPVIRQTVLDESLELAPGKPQVLGLLDVPGTTRRQEVAVVVELVH
ncbi:MAG: hypothetical protein ABSF23_04345 [Terracidiphilus sp.]|jgi:type II secretory pathway component GspD/PulD (secretin)